MAKPPLTSTITAQKASSEQVTQQVSHEKSILIEPYEIWDIYSKKNKEIEYFLSSLLSNARFTERSNF